MEDNQGHKRDRIVRVLFEHTIVRWVRESRYYYIDSEEETPDGLLVTLRVRQESEIVQWLLSWGKHVYVLEPESLRQTLIQEAQAIVQRNATDIPLSQG
jgi:predicted DNA-binding transcriptional regulator YafY